MPLIFKARIKFYIFFLIERCILSVCMLASRQHSTLKSKEEKSSLSPSLQAKSLGMPCSCLENYCNYLQSKKISKSKIQREKMSLTYLSLCSCLCQGLERYFYFLETSVLFSWRSGVKSAYQHC